MSPFSIGPPKPPYIVLVDDNPVYLETAKALIETELIGFTVFKAIGPIEAIAIRNSLDGPAIFMSDYDMPDMNGLRFLRYIISSSRFRVFPYLVTAHDDHRIFSEGLRSGILYISKIEPPGGKPFNLGDLYKDHILFAVEELKKMHTKDGLTGLDTTAEAFVVWQHDFARAKRDVTPMSLIFADMDYLKQTNDTEGHLVGDAALKKIAKALTDVTRSSFDLVFRNSAKADEFAILLPNTNRHEALKILKRTRDNLDGIEVDGKSGKIQVYTSVGVATLRPDQLGSDPSSAFERLLELADKSMYKAKIANKAARQVSSL